MIHKKTLFVLIILIGILSIACHNLKGKAPGKTKTRSASQELITDLRLDSCSREWVYSDLSRDIIVKALLFEPESYYDVLKYPAFLVGVTESSDTIAIIDKSYKGNIECGMLYTINTVQWSDAEKQALKPLFVKYTDPKRNELYCSVRIVYYGSIRS